MNVTPIVARIDSELRTAGNPRRALQEKRYLKSELEHYGVSVPAIRAIAKAGLADCPDLTRAELRELVDGLWSVPVHERRLAAVELLRFRAAILDAADLVLLERLIRESRTWALVDVLAAVVVGPLVERFPELGETLDRWALDDDFWLRRSSLLALLGPLRRGAGDFERFSRHADAMLDEREFFIRKAIGWVLREMGRKRPELVFDWLLPRVQRASGVTLREAAKYLPDEQQDVILGAYRSRHGRTTAVR